MIYDISPMKNLVSIFDYIEFDEFKQYYLKFWYKNSQLEAWDYFMSAIKHLPSTATTRYDAVDVTRQMLEEIHRYLYYNIIEVC